MLTLAFSRVVKHALCGLILIKAYTCDGKTISNRINSVS